MEYVAGQTNVNLRYDKEAGTDKAYVIYLVG